MRALKLLETKCKKSLKGTPIYREFLVMRRGIITGGFINEI